MLMFIKNHALRRTQGIHVYIPYSIYLIGLLLKSKTFALVTFFLSADRKC